MRLAFYNQKRFLIIYLEIASHRSTFLIFKTTHLPKHVGIIMDGNRRYAKQRGLCMPMGHHLGGEKLSEIISWWLELSTLYCAPTSSSTSFSPTLGQRSILQAENFKPKVEFESNCKRASSSTTQPLTLVETPLIPSLTVWAFSTDNFKRSPPELHELLNLFNQELTSILISGYLTRHRVRVTIFGEKNLLPEYLRETIHRVEVATREYPPLFNFQIAFPYGGRDEVAMAATRALHSKYLKPSLVGSPISSYENSTKQSFRGSRKISKGRHRRQRHKAMSTIDPSKWILTVDDISQHTYIAQISDIGSSSPYSYIFNKTTPPPVDFIIRTSNEVRLSGFMLWDSALAEYCFMKCLWPDFSKLEFFNAIMDFTRREIRLGE